MERRFCYYPYYGTSLITTQQLWIHKVYFFPVLFSLRSLCPEMAAIFFCISNFGSINNDYIVHQLLICVCFLIFLFFSFLWVLLHALLPLFRWPCLCANNVGFSRPHLHELQEICQLLVSEVSSTHFFSLLFPFLFSFYLLVKLLVLQYGSARFG